MNLESQTKLQRQLWLPALELSNLWVRLNSSFLISTMGLIISALRAFSGDQMGSSIFKRSYPGHATHVGDFTVLL